LIIFLFVRGVLIYDGVTGTDFFNLSFQERKSLDCVKEGNFIDEAAAVQDQDFIGSAAEEKFRS